MQANENDSLRLAKNVLAGESITAEWALELAKGLKTDHIGYARMTSGYEATEKALQDIKGFSFDTTAPTDWKLLKLEPLLRDRGE